MNGFADIDREFHRLDDVLAAAVPLPAVDDVISRAAGARRATSAAAAAVLTVGSLGGITAVATAAAPGGSFVGPPFAIAAPQESGPTPEPVETGGAGGATGGQGGLPPAFDPTVAATQGGALPGGGGSPAAPAPGPA
ncbi:hypothetical protein GSF26_27500, partial [Pseudonocardia alni]|nr:hypothetical protein [Pseudonocardia alni]